MNEVYEFLERLGSLIRAEQRHTGLSLGLQPVHMQVLAYLQKCNRFSDTPMAVAAYLGITKGTLSQSLKVLEKNKLIDKHADIHDRRVVHLSLNDKGKHWLKQLDPQPSWRQALDTMDPATVAALQQGLSQLLRSLQQAQDFHTFGQCKSCRHLQCHENQFTCGLTGEALTPPDTDKICLEHAFPVPAATLS